VAVRRRDLQAFQLDASSPYTPTSCRDELYVSRTSSATHCVSDTTTATVQTILRDRVLGKLPLCCRPASTISSTPVEVLRHDEQLAVYGAAAERISSPPARLWVRCG
jgi:hypothetical protein